MAVRFGKDGTLYASTIRYKYKQARNIVADGTFGSTTDSLHNVWSWSGCTLIESTNPSNGGYKSYRCMRLNQTSGVAMLECPMPTPIAGHKYYGGCMYRTTGSEGAGIGGDTRFEWYIADAATGQLVFGHKNTHTGGKWKKLSSVQTLSSVMGGSWKIRQFTASSNTQIDVCRHIIIDLTDTFGAGNEPTKDWCDNNIREWETLTNFGSVWGYHPKGYTAEWSFSGLANSVWFDWNSLDSNWEPREYMVGMQGSPSNNEGLMTSNFTKALSPSLQYYISYDAMASADYSHTYTINIYWPIAEPSMGQFNPRRLPDQTGGGGMNNWRRYSWYGTRSQFSAGNYQMRIDLDNVASSMEMRLTNIGCVNVAENISQYNSYYGSGISLSDVNKEWCDRWIDQRSAPIIHIGDPKSTQITMKKFAKLANRTTLNSYPEANLKSWIGIDDTWGGFEPSQNTHLSVGDRICFPCTIENGVKCYFIGIFKGISGTTLSMYNEAYCKEGSAEYTSCELGYDIVCNDIEIRPEVNKVIFKPNGTIVCKKLVKTLNY